MPESSRSEPRDSNPGHGEARNNLAFPSPPEPLPAVAAILVGVPGDVEAGSAGLVSGLGGESGFYSRPTPTLKNHFKGSTSSVVWVMLLPVPEIGGELLSQGPWTFVAPYRR